MFSREKVDAVYHLREAVEEKIRLEFEVDAHPTRRAKDRLLDATLNVESCTQRALEVCHACGRPHQDDVETCAEFSHSGSSNVVDVDFQRGSRIDRGR
jgi:hypothetical protein